MVGRSGERNQGSARFAAAIKGLSFLGIDPGETRQMCGIAGGFSFGAGLPVENTIVTRVDEFQRHRGPDGEGV